jgi:hypothetical protein
MTKSFIQYVHVLCIPSRVFQIHLYVKCSRSPLLFCAHGFVTVSRSIQRYDTAFSGYGLADGTFNTKITLIINLFERNVWNLLLIG